MNKNISEILKNTTAAVEVKRDVPHVYSNLCSWSGSILEAKLNQRKIPVCPFCGSSLMQIKDDESFWAAVRHRESLGMTNYEDLMRWKETKKCCWPTMDAAANVYTLQTKKTVVLRLPTNERKSNT